MADYIKSGQTQIIVKEETTRGTFNAPLAADNNIRLHYDGIMSNDSTKEVIGKTANGRMGDGRHYMREHVMTLPELTVEFVPASAPTTAPKWLKLATSCGVTEYTTPTTLEKGIYWNGQVACSNLSAVIEMYDCGTSPEGQVHQLRGIAGNFELKTESAQGPFVMTYSDLKGAWLGPSDRAAAPIDPLTGNDTALAEMSGLYLWTFGGVQLPVWAYSFNTNNDVNFIPGNNDEGIAYFDVVSQGARMMCTVPITDTVTKDFVDDYFNNTIISDVSAVGQTGANWDFTHNDCEVVNISYTEVNGQLAGEIEFNVLTDAIWVQK